jgi:hypothetical protein
MGEGGCPSFLAIEKLFQRPLSRYCFLGSVYKTLLRGKILRIFSLFANFFVFASEIKCLLFLEVLSLV